MSPYQLPGDAVYDYCKREKYLQPKYTKMHVKGESARDVLCGVRARSGPDGGPTYIL